MFKIDINMLASLAARSSAGCHKCQMCYEVPKVTVSWHFGMSWVLSKEIKATAKDALAGGFLEILVGNFEWLHSFFSGTSRATITHSNMNISKEHSEWAPKVIFSWNWEWRGLNPLNWYRQLFCFWHKWLHNFFPKQVRILLLGKKYEYLELIARWWAQRWNCI